MADKVRYFKDEMFYCFYATRKGGWFFYSEKGIVVHNSADAAANGQIIGIADVVFHFMTEVIILLHFRNSFQMTRKLYFKFSKNMLKIAEKT